ncbi:MAG: 50S ribosomal protein L3 [Candidatus Firestonebacteria bacterium RIFOXYA2_FULL_40_8]|nr:ribosomal protein L3 [uncultured bacterium]OGF51227.1 MAG: 50S ribosomal protein L3 [Candidatus Firestonebacteria bacterium RIFOXYA2_FULL_40_8]
MIKGKGILGKKLGMTQILQDGKAEPVTVVQAGPCIVTQLKTKKTDGYDAIQVGFIEKKKNINKPKAGHFKKANTTAKQFVREFRVEDASKFQLGQTISADLFVPGEYVNVTGLDKGRGFQGVVKRHGFRGGPGSHGSNFHRAPGGIGGRVRVAGHIWKGRRMPGHMGMTTKTALNLRVLLVDKEDNIILVRGAVPGSNESLVVLTASKNIARLMKRDQRRTDEENKRLALLAAKEKADKEKKKTPARPAGGKK